MKRIAIITARGGSKRIPRKNIKEFCGSPIISYSITAALESKLFDEVMVSTDDNEIAEISLKYGAKVPFLRSKENANDYAGTADVLKEVLNEYKKIGMNFDQMVCIYPTSPFITASKIKQVVNIISNDDNIDMVTPVVAYSFPPQRAFIINDNNNLQYQYPEHRLTRSQDLPKIYHDCGQFYAYKVDSFLNKSFDLFINKPYILPETEVQDIDNIEDWEIAEMKYSLMKKRLDNE